MSEDHCDRFVDANARVHSKKPRNPYPLLARRILKRILPSSLYRRHIGRHEDTSLAIWRHLANQLADDRSVLDVGAFRGEFASAARLVNPSIPIYAFEPNPNSFSAIESAMTEQSIKVMPLALSDHHGMVKFVLRSTTSQIAKDQFGDDEQVAVQATTLDHWRQQSGAKVGLIKIDTEGEETAILSGAQVTLKEDQPFILCEVLTDHAGQTVKSTLPDHYLTYHVDENRGISRRTVINREQWRNYNWVFVPQAQVALLSDFMQS